MTGAVANCGHMKSSRGLGYQRALVWLQSLGEGRHTAVGAGDRSWWTGHAGALLQRLAVSIMMQANDRIRARSRCTSTHGFLGYWHAVMSLQMYLLVHAWQ